MRPPHILLIVGGGIAAYKACELIRLIRKAGMSVRRTQTTPAAASRAQISPSPSATSAASDGEGTEPVGRSLSAVLNEKPSTPTKLTPIR